MANFVSHWLASDKDARAAVIDASPLDEAARRHFAPFGERMQFVQGDVVSPATWAAPARRHRLCRPRRGGHLPQLPGQGRQAPQPREGKSLPRARGERPGYGSGAHLRPRPTGARALRLCQHRLGLRRRGAGPGNESLPAARGRLHRPASLLRHRQIRQRADHQALRQAVRHAGPHHPARERVRAPWTGPRPCATCAMPPTASPMPRRPEGPCAPSRPTRSATTSMRPTSRSRFAACCWRRKHP